MTFDFVLCGAHVVMCLVLVIGLWGDHDERFL